MLYKQTNKLTLIFSTKILTCSSAESVGQQKAFKHFMKTMEKLTFNSRTLEVFKKTIIHA